MFDNDICEFDVTILAETDKALLIQIDGDEEIWVPKRAVDKDASTALHKGDTGTIYIQTWWAETRHLV